MRKFVKAVAVLALAVSVLSTSAFAAVDKVAAGTYSTTVTQSVSGEQVTLLAVDKTAVNLTGEEPVLSNVTDGDIYYIDQNDTGIFTNFQVKDGYVGQELFFFAGTASSNNAIYLGNAENLASITIAAPNYVAPIEVNATVALGMSYDDGARLSDADVTWVATKDGNAVEGVLSATSAEGATFTGVAAGTYTVTASAKGVTSNAVTIVVEEPGFQIDAVKKDIINTDSTHEAAVEQNGIGVALTVNVPVDFQKIVWVFTDGTDRYYSDSMPFIGIAGSVTIGAAAPNGNNISNTTEKINVTGFDAIFLVDEDTAYFTNEEADAGNKDRVVTE